MGEVRSGVLLPGALPEIWESLIICNGIMWTYIVIAEYLNAKAGLGALIRDSEKTLATAPIVVGVYPGRAFPRTLARRAPVGAAKPVARAAETMFPLASNSARASVAE